MYVRVDLFMWRFLSAIFVQRLPKTPLIYNPPALSVNKRVGVTLPVSFLETRHLTIYPRLSLWLTVDVKCLPPDSQF